MTEKDNSQAREGFRDDLQRAGVLSPAGAPGLYDRHEQYERVTEKVNQLITRTREETRFLFNDSAYTVHRFGPILPAAVYDKTDYIASFPQLTGIISTFEGGDREHKQLLRAHADGSTLNHLMSTSEVRMVSAACHPLYARLPQTLPAAGVFSDVEGWCFRNEPSHDPMRQQAFRMRELVFAGDASAATAFRETWIPHVTRMLSSIGLSSAEVSANDPFFGRFGKMLAEGQLEHDLKTEFVVDIYGDGFEPVAIASCNDAQDHFGTRFSLHDAQGNTAHTACTAFGLDRITLALFRTFGMNPDEWPLPVQKALAL